MNSDLSSIYGATNCSNGSERLEGRISSSSCSKKCNETKSLDIIDEFKRNYEDKMRAIDSEGGGDCNIRAKLSLQQEWIRDLTEQNELLAKAVDELEQETTERVLALEERLKQSSKAASEVMNGYSGISWNLEETFQFINHLQNDVHNLVELIRKVRNYGTWDATNLKLYTISKDDLLLNELYPNGVVEDAKVNEELNEKDNLIKDLKIKIEKLSNEDLKKSLEDYATLQQSMLDMRDALTAEVADKHDTIITLRRDVQVLEEQCRKADQQTHFKDDIIKELRKEIKQLKHEHKIKTRSTSKSFSIHAEKGEPNDPCIYDCPLTFHNNIEKYTDTEKNIVIFVCEDMNQREVHRLFDGNSLQVVYKNPKTVHEYNTQFLKGTINKEFLNSKLDNEIEHDQAKSCDVVRNAKKVNIYNSNPIPFETPVKDHSIDNFNEELKNASNLKTDNFQKFEVLNSHPSIKVDYCLQSKQKKLLKRSSKEKNRSKSMNCFTCVTDNYGYYEKSPFFDKASPQTVELLTYDVKSPLSLPKNFKQFSSSVFYENLLNKCEKRDVSSNSSFDTSLSGRKSF